MQAEQAEAEYMKADRKLWQRMDASKVQSIKMAGTNFVRASTIFGSVNDKSTFVAWAEEHAPELLGPQPRKGLVNELVRQRIDNNEDLPPGVTWYSRDYIARRAA